LCLAGCLYEPSRASAPERTESDSHRKSREDRKPTSEDLPADRQMYFLDANRDQALYRHLRRGDRVDIWAVVDRGTLADAYREDRVDAEPDSEYDQPIVVQFLQRPSRLAIDSTFWRLSVARTLSPTETSLRATSGAYWYRVLRSSPFPTSVPRTE
jgi:hypothetical protein